MNAYPPPEPTWLPKARIQALAEEFAEKIGFSPGRSLREFVEKLNGKIQYYGEEDLDRDRRGGSLIVEKSGFVIKLSNFTGILRDRFTIAHELGHFVLHAHCGAKAPLEADRHMPSTPSDDQERAEWEANWFAGAFLMPTKEVLRLKSQTLSVTQMASHFQVSPKAMEVRLKQIPVTAVLAEA